MAKWIKKTPYGDYREKNYHGAENDAYYKRIIASVRGRITSGVTALTNMKHFGSKIQTIKKYCN